MLLESLGFSRAPRLGVITFDAVTEIDETYTSTLTEYPIDTGAIVNDHAYLNPDKLVMEAFVSSKDNGNENDSLLRLGVGALDAVLGGNALKYATQVFAGYASGQDSSRVVAAKNLILSMHKTQSEIFVTTGSGFMSNMVITELNIYTDTTMESAIRFTLGLQEVIKVNTGDVVNSLLSDRLIPSGVGKVVTGNLGTEVASGTFLEDSTAFLEDIF